MTVMPSAGSTNGGKARRGLGGSRRHRNDQTRNKHQTTSCRRIAYPLFPLTVSKSSVDTIQYNISADQGALSGHLSAFHRPKTAEAKIGIMPTTSERRRLVDNSAAAYEEPLTPTVKRALLALVILFHVGGGWALTQVEPVKLVVGEIAPMEVRMVPAEQLAQPDVPLDEPPPLPELKPPPPDLATVVEPPPPDLPPPVFPVEAPPPPPPPEPEKPKPPPPKPVQKRPPTPQAPVDAQPQQAAPAAPAAPKTVSASQLGYVVPPNPIYPARSRKAGEQGNAVVRVLVDVTGRPAQVSLQTSSGHPELDQSALSAVRAAQFRPYAEGGVAQAVWVLVPINFVLR